MNASLSSHASAAALLVTVLASTTPAQSADALASDLKNGPTSGRIHIAEPYPPGYTIIEGDIIVPESDTDTYAATTFEGSLRWTNKQVYYQFDVNVHPSQEAIVEQAMADWEAVSDVTFVEFQASNHIHIRVSDNDADPKCSSSVGMIGGTQTLNITASCLTNLKIHHEIGHALGLHHEHKRGDAETYVSFNLQNIEAGQGSNFFPPEPFAEDYGPYDFESIMHYDDYAFSICSPQDVSDGLCSPALTTIDVNPPWDVAYQDVIGQRDYLSAWDVTLMSFLYAENDWVFGDDDYNGVPDGSFLQPWPNFATALVSTPIGGQVIALSPETVSGLGTLDDAVTILAPLGGLVLD